MSNHRRTFAIGDPLEATQTLPVLRRQPVPRAWPHACMTEQAACAWENLYNVADAKRARLKLERDAAYDALRALHAAVGKGALIGCEHPAFYMVGQLISGVRSVSPTVEALRELLDAAVPFGMCDDDPIQIAKDKARAVLGIRL